MWGGWRGSKGRLPTVRPNPCHPPHVTLTSCLWSRPSTCPLELPASCPFWKGSEPSGLHLAELTAWRWPDRAARRAPQLPSSSKGSLLGYPTLSCCPQPHLHLTHTILMGLSVFHLRWDCELLCTSISRWSPFVNYLLYPLSIFCYAVSSFANTRKVFIYYGY